MRLVVVQLLSYLLLGLIIVDTSENSIRQSN